MRDLIERCWKGYEPVPGKEPYSNDSCRKKQGKKQEKKKSSKEDADDDWMKQDDDDPLFTKGMIMGRDKNKKKNEQHSFYSRIATMLTEGETAAWQRKAGKNPKGGLNKKGVASYRAANPGSKLKTAVTTKPSKLKKGSKSAKRRKSFCARMSGMRKRQKASNNTGKDRLSLSLKKWNC
jgi:hypothetical protein